ncbi:hypothetical protein E3Q14_00419 [Wallemia mellicola]|nr:hypothetical protein E3Q14_00419 [Wallemia mellicola]
MSIKQNWKSLHFFDCSLEASTFESWDDCLMTSSDQFTIKIRRDGTIFQYNSKFELINTWIGFQDSRCLHLSIANDTLIALAENTSNYPVIKCWNLLDSSKLLYNSVLEHNDEPHPISAFTISEDMSIAAIGLANGNMIIIHNLKDTIQTSEQFKSFRINLAIKEPITDLLFSRSENSLFILSPSSLLVSRFDSKGGYTISPLDDIGSQLNCLQMSPINSASVVVARDEALYLYGLEGRRATYALEGEKTFIKRFFKYIVLCMPSKSKPSVNSVTIIDLKFKYIAYKGDIAENVCEVLISGNKLHVLCDDGKVYTLHEKSVFSKLELLYKSNYYLLAFDIVADSKLEKYIEMDVHKRYADYLYQKNDYDLATQEYCKTIGYVEPSSIIRKFLDHQRIHDLVKYLQEVHYKGNANPDYTTLLLNCLIKIKDIDCLDSFITQSNNDNQVQFDLQTAVRVLRQAGYINHALQLSTTYLRHDDVLKIQIEDRKDWDAALKYLSKLSPDNVENYLHHYGRLLLEYNCQVTTHLLIELCSGSYRPKNADSDVTDQLSLRKSKFNSIAANTINYIGFNASNSSRNSSTEEDDVYKPPSPLKYFSQFINYPNQLIIFIESIMKLRFGIEFTSDNIIIKEVQSIYDEQNFNNVSASLNTILELYVQEAGASESPEIQRELHSKALMLIDNYERIPIDLNHALMICTIESFDEGKVKLWKFLEAYEEIIYHHMAQADTSTNREDEERSTDAIFESIKNFGKFVPRMYLVVLDFLSNNIEGHNNRTVIQNLLELIDNVRDEFTKKHMNDEVIRLPQMSEIVQILSKPGVHNGIVKEWIIRKVKEDEEKTKVDELLLMSYKEETIKKENQIKELNDVNKAQTFQNTRCSSTGERLELPAIHFACGHSFNMSVLADNETECPICARSHGMIRELRRNQKDLLEKHDTFIKGVSNEGFKLISSNFANKLF